MDKATWCRTPASASAASRWLVTVLKNWTALDGLRDVVFDTSITASAPFSASARPVPVTRSTPADRLITTVSCPAARAASTTYRPTTPVPPATAIRILFTSLIP